MINPGISSEEAENCDDGDDWRSMSAVSEDIGLICDILPAPSSTWVHGASGLSRGACLVVDAVDGVLPDSTTVGFLGVSATALGVVLRVGRGDWGGVLVEEPMLIGERLRDRSSSGIYSG